MGEPQKDISPALSDLVAGLCLCRAKKEEELAGTFFQAPLFSDFFKSKLTLCWSDFTAGAGYFLHECTRSSNKHTTAIPTKHRGN